MRNCATKWLAEVDRRDLTRADAAVGRAWINTYRDRAPKVVDVGMILKRFCWAEDGFQGLVCLSETELLTNTSVSARDRMTRRQMCEGVIGRVLQHLLYAGSCAYLPVVITSRCDQLNLWLADVKAPEQSMRHSRMPSTVGVRIEWCHPMAMEPDFWREENE
jgi:hypothetical protein